MLTGAVVSADVEIKKGTSASVWDLSEKVRKAQT
jgi:hypothetical protein